MNKTAIKVLLIEDNPGDARLIQELLREVTSSQFHLEHVERLAEGLQHLDEETCDVLLLDLGLPDSQGLDTFTTIQTQAPHVTIILLTGFDDETFALEAVRKGAQDYLVKDRIDGNLLARAIRYAVERRRLEEQYRQAQKMEALGQLTGGIAHDFNNLLTVMNGFTELIRAQLLPDDPLQEMVDKILKAGQQSSNLIRQMLAFSRRQIIEPQILDLNSVVVEMDSMLGRFIREDIELKTHLSPGLWSVKIDPTQIEQIIINMVVNARDAMPKGGRVTIETANVVLDDNYAMNHAEARPGEHVLLAICDTGLGMSQDVKNRIFEPFFTTKEKDRGTGLGLATVFGIVKQHGGNIWCYSEIGQGTTFKIYLPRAQEVAQPLAKPEIGAEMPSGNETILLVEDDSGVREFMRRILQGQGYTLLEAQDGREAVLLSTRYSGPIHLLLTDIVMPGMSGKDVADQLSQTHPNLKVLFTSGYTDNAIVYHGVLDVGTAFLQKPFSPMDLAHKVREVLNK